MSKPLNDPDSGTARQSTDFRPAMTVRAVVAAVSGLVLMAMGIQAGRIWLAMGPADEYGLPLQAVVYLVLLLGIGGGMAALWSRRLLTRAELICVFYALVLAAPLMTQGFWHRVVSITTTIPRSADFVKLEHLSDRLWPHGPNLLGARMAESVPLEGEEGEVVHRVVLPVGGRGEHAIVPGEPYLLALQVRVSGLDADASYFVRARHPDGGDGQEILRSRQGKPGGGFLPTGAYGVVFSGFGENEELWLEFGLRGKGSVEIRHAQLLNVSAVEFASTGMEQMPAQVFDQLPLEDRAGLLRRPERMWSLEGLAFAFGGGIPFAAWSGPMVAWGSLIGLMLAGALAINVLMRRQWLDSERYPLPLTRIPAALIGSPGDPGALGMIWRNQGLWAGAVLGLAWGLLKGLHFYNPAIPNTAIQIDLSPYFGPAWGGFWTGVQFEVVAIFVAVAVFVELNVLMSLVVGFLAYRALFWLGGITGMSGMAGYPFGQQQQTGAFLLYGLLVLVLSHKHLRQTWREAIRPSLTPPDKREVMGYRAAYLLLGGVLAGGVGWAVWLGISVGGTLIFLGFMLLVALVASKFRAEAGVPYGQFTPETAAMVLLLVGGIPVFGADMVLMTFLASFLFSGAIFFLLPGAQLEMLEMGRTYRVRGRDLLGMMVLGLAGGLLVGGWIFLGQAYSSGGDAMRFTWAFATKVWYFAEFNTALSASGAEAGEGGSGWIPSNWAYVFGGGVTAILTLLRQIFAGFWMHPIGFVLGPSFFSKVLWGSLLVAWVLRFAFVRLGGAMAVRTKLQPFFIGVFLGAGASWMVWLVTGLILQSQGAELIYGGLP